MAVIGKIRKHSGLAVILVGVAIAAFVLSDFFRAGPGGQMKNVGVIEGEEISYTDFNFKVEDNMEAQKASNNGEPLNTGQQFTVRQNTWDQFVNEILMDRESENLGIAVTTEELFDQVQGENPHRLIKQYFVNPETQQYDRTFVIRYLQNIDQLPPDQRKQWVNFEQFIKRDRLNTKYNNLISKGYYVPEAFAKMQYENQKKNAEMLIGYKKFVDIADSLISSTDDDFRKYYDENSYKFQQEETKDVDYVIFDVTPSQKDFDMTEHDFKRLYEEFKTTDNVTYFVNAVSDQRYDSVWWDDGTLPIAFDTVFINAEPGAMVAPYFEDNAWHMAKLVDIQDRPDSAKAEHILITYQGGLRAAEDITRTKDDAQQLADSLYNVIRRNPAKLAQLAKDYSNDGSVQQNNGDLGWFPDGNMVHAFNQATIMGKKGDIKLIETPFGYHVVRVLDVLPATKKLRVAVVDRSIEASSETFQNVYVEASKFAGENNSVEKFSQAAADLGLDKRNATHLRNMSNSIPGLDFARPIIRWAHSENSSLGSVSPVFDMDGQYIVAVITAERDKGPIPYDELKDRIINNIKNEKKGEMLMAQINEKNASGFYDVISAIDMKIDTNNNLTFSSRNIPGFGAEQDIIGSIFSMNEGDVIGPIKGNGGVFIIQLNRFGEVPALGSYALYRSDLVNEFDRRVENNYPFRAIEKNADIEDNRMWFY